MEITAGLRNLLIETAESLSGADGSASWPTLSTSSNSGNAKPHVGLAGAGTHFARPATRSARALPARMPSACADASRLSSICPISSTTFAVWSRTTFRPTPPSRPPACIVASSAPRGPQAVDRTRRLHRRAVAFRANHYLQAQRPGFPVAHGCQKPAPKKLKETDAIFQNLTEVHQRAARSEDTLRLSCDAKAPVLIGPFSRGGKSRRGTKGADHDFKPWGKINSLRHLLTRSEGVELLFHFLEGDQRFQRLLAEADSVMLFHNCS